MPQIPGVARRPDDVPCLFVADRGDSALRLDKALLRRLQMIPRLSRTRVQRWIDERLVLVNGTPATRASASLTSGDKVAIIAPDAVQRRRRPEPEAIALTVLFEDDHVLALDKPPGQVVHPAYKHAGGTLFNGVLAHLGRTSTDGVNAPRLLQRLDRDTSGVLLVSKHLAAHRSLQRAMAAGDLVKEYLAVVHGKPSRAQGRITLPLGQDPADRRRVAVREDGRPSETRYERLASGGGMSLLRCLLITGRTHQIRVHTAAMGWPIVGDSVYGAGGGNSARQALHAWRVAFPHPQSGLTISLTAPVPADMAVLLGDAGIRWATCLR